MDWMYGHHLDINFFVLLLSKTHKTKQCFCQLHNVCITLRSSYLLELIPMQHFFISCCMYFTD